MITKEKRFVYGTRTKMYHLVEEGDRDYEKGISLSAMKADEGIAKDLSTFNILKDEDGFVQSLPDAIVQVLK